MGSLTGSRCAAGQRSARSYDNTNGSPIGSGWSHLMPIATTASGGNRRRRHTIAFPSPNRPEVEHEIDGPAPRELRPRRGARVGAAARVSDLTPVSRRPGPVGTHESAFAAIQRTVSESPWRENGVFRRVKTSRESPPAVEELVLVLLESTGRRLQPAESVIEPGRSRHGVSGTCRHKVITIHRPHLRQLIF